MRLLFVTDRLKIFCFLHKQLDSRRLDVFLVIIEGLDRVWPHFFPLNKVLTTSASRGMTDLFC